MNRVASACDKIIEYSFYLLFSLVPLIFTPWNFELFEFNKMIVTYTLTVIIVGAFLIKSVAKRELRVSRTPLDIPILLFLAALIISTIYSIDVHTSIWGYYSRFNGGLASMICYSLLYFVFVNTMNVKRVYRAILVSVFSGLLVVLWGLPSHFGYDPTCFLLQGNFDTSCWTEQFRPEIRVFSTLGQPNWLAAYLSILIPIAIAFGLNSFKPPANSPKRNYVSRIMYYAKNKKIILTTLYILLTTLFYFALLFTSSRSGFASLGVGLLFFVGVFLYTSGFKPLDFKRVLTKPYTLNPIRYLFVVLVFIGIITFLIGTPFEQLNKFTLPTIIKQVSPAINEAEIPIERPKQVSPVLETGGTESAEIRKIVWKGAIDIAKHYPLFGSGVETFAYAYYRFRPVEHNLTSEWDFLYNKAHNEYLNYLATTGFVGLGSYLLMIGIFFLNVMPNLFRHLNIAKNKTLKSPPRRDPAEAGQVQGDKEKTHNTNYMLLTTSLLAGYISILISNFFGFSVVITNLYLFLIPAFVFILNGAVSPQKAFVLPLRELRIMNHELKTSLIQFVFSVTVILTSLFLILNVFRFWVADAQYAQGYNLDRSGQFAQAYQPLFIASALRSDEPVFYDELAINNASLATFFGIEDATTSATLVRNALTLSDQAVKNHPNNVTFWKSRARILYTLSEVDQQYLDQSIASIEKAKQLAPTDAKVAYNLAVLYGQADRLDEAVKTLEETIKLKPDYHDAYYALGLFYNEQGNRAKAIEQMEYILDKIASDDADARDRLTEWRGF